MRKTSNSIFFFFFWKCVFFKLWSLSSPKAGFLKKAEAELYEPQRENHFTGALENTFLCKTDIYLKLQYNLFEKAVFFNMWSLISPKGAFLKTKESELFQLKTKEHFTGASENTFLQMVDTYLKLQQQFSFWKMCLFQTVIFDLSKTCIPEN